MLTAAAAAVVTQVDTAVAIQVDMVCTLYSLQRRIMRLDKGINNTFFSIYSLLLTRIQLNLSYIFDKKDQLHQLSSIHDHLNLLFFL